MIVVIKSDCYGAHVKTGLIKDDFIYQIFPKKHREGFDEAVIETMLPYCIVILHIFI